MIDWYEYLRDAIAVNKPRMDGWSMRSGWSSTDLKRGCGYDASCEITPVTNKLVAKLLVGISSIFSNRRSRNGPEMNECTVE